VIASVGEVAPNALFVAGRDWQRLDALGLLERGLPILNLIQHVRHAEEWSIQSRYLERKAIRLCVSAEVAEAVQAAGSQGPTVVIPNGVDIPEASAASLGGPPLDLLVAGLKQPVLAREAAARLAAPGRSIEVFTEHVPRDEFLAAMRRARVTLYLPNEEEGFYLPALEGMALGTTVVCPDVVGNRSFCLPGVTAYRPAFQLDALVAATEEALALPDAGRVILLAQARKMAQRHSLEAERRAFQDVLANLGDLWAQA
jgi:glycosyltransferase involved in cell wall biosynthesis